MYKKFLIMLFSTVILFISQGNVWAAANNINGQTQEKYTLIDKDFFSNNETFQLSAVKDYPGNKIAWIASIFIMGLGQILMGDVMKGLSFYFIDIIVFILGIIIFFISPKAASGIPYYWFYTIILVSVTWIAVYIWNIYDAYHMSRELNEENKELSLLNEKLSKIMKITNKINISGNEINYQVFSF
jgi:hypothetical protein